MLKITVVGLISAVLVAGLLGFKFVAYDLEDEFNKNMMEAEKINAFKLIYQYIPDINSDEDVASFCTDYLGLNLHPYEITMIKILDKLKNINLFNLK